MKGSIFNVDRPMLMRKTLEHLGVRFGERTGWQSVKCPNSFAHSHGDRLPSGSVNLARGTFTCFACGLRGDGFDLLLTLEGWKAPQVVEFLEMDKLPEETDWIGWG